MSHFLSAEPKSLANRRVTRYTYIARKDVTKYRMEPYPYLVKVPKIIDVEINHPEVREDVESVASVVPVVQGISIDSSQNYVVISDNLRPSYKLRKLDFEFAPTKIYSFTPNVSGYYKITTSGCDNVYGIIYENGNVIKQQSGENLSFHDVHLKAGYTYKLKIKDKGNSGVFKVNIDFDYQVIRIPQRGSEWWIDGRNRNTAMTNMRYTVIRFYGVSEVSDLVDELKEDPTFESINADHVSNIGIAGVVELVAKSCGSSGAGLAFYLAVELILWELDMIELERNTLVENMADAIEQNGSGYIVEKCGFNEQMSGMFTIYEHCSTNTYKAPDGHWGSFK